MNRREQITKHVTLEAYGIEIGPWHNPLVPKRLGYNCKVLDVYDTRTLRQRAHDDPDIPNELVQYIEEVDLVGSSSCIEELVQAKYELGSFDYIISSHNFEHIPNPIKFLKGCEAVLRPGGMLSMAIPDRRGCFDFFRPTSSLAQFLEAWFAKREKPTQTQIFERLSLHSRVIQNSFESISFSLDINSTDVIPFHTLREAFQAWKEFNSNPDEIYRDTHCWTFTPSSLELILNDLRFLDIISLEVQEVANFGENEFYIHIKKPASSAKSQINPSEFYNMRQRLIHGAHNEFSSNVLSNHCLDLDKQRANMARLEKELNAIKTSRSWRITYPIRELSSLACKLMVFLLKK